MVADRAKRQSVAGASALGFAHRMPSYLPAMTRDEIAVARMVYAIEPSGPAFGARTFDERAFRSPHYTVDVAGLVGGLYVGEASLSSCGTLLLDEAIKFQPDALEALLDALNHGHAHIRPRGLKGYPGPAVVVPVPVIPRLVVAIVPPASARKGRAAKVLDAFGWDAEIELG